MDSIKDIFSRLKKRERLLILTSIFLLIAFGVYGLIVRPVSNSLQDSEDQLRSKQLLLRRYYRLLGNEEIYEKELEEYKDTYASLQTFFLTAETEELATAELQKTVKDIATRNGLAVSRSTATARKTLNEDPRLILISGNFTLGELDKVRKIQSFLYDVEHNNETILFIDDFRIRGVGTDTSRRSALITATLTAVARIEKRL